VVQAAMAAPHGTNRPAQIPGCWGMPPRASSQRWELALRLQLGVIARTAWAMRSGLEPL